MKKIISLECSIGCERFRQCWGGYLDEDPKCDKTRENNIKLIEEEKSLEGVTSGPTPKGLFYWAVGKRVAEMGNGKLEIY